jgi:hypothetical protein
MKQGRSNINDVSKRFGLLSLHCSGRDPHGWTRAASIERPVLEYGQIRELNKKGFITIPRQENFVNQGIQKSISLTGTQLHPWNGNKKY